MTPIEAARAVFAGTPEFAVPSLNALLESGIAIDCVLTQPDRRAGRGRRLTQSPVKQFAVEHGIDLKQPERLDEDFRNVLSKARPDLLVVVAYGLILPQWLLDWPKLASVNVHASLLPRWRGAAPIQHAILSGDRETGVSLMRMTRGLDSGPIYRQRAIPIANSETAGELHDRLAGLGAELLLESLPDLLSATLNAKPQDERDMTYAPKLQKRHAALDWELSASELERKVRAFNPWPVAETLTSTGERLRVWAAEAEPDTAGQMPGMVVEPMDGRVRVATGSGLLRLTQLQPPGGRVMSAAAYLAAHDLRGAVFAGPD